MNNSVYHTELSSHEETRRQFNGSRCSIKLRIDVHQDFCVVVMQEGGSNPKPPQRFAKEAFLYWAARLKQKSGAEIYAVYEACGFGFTLQRQLSALSIRCYVVSVQENKDALALVRVPTEEEERSRAIHRQREQLVTVRKVLETQGRSLMVNHGIEPVQQWWKRRGLPH
jgi:transposase